MKLPTLRYGDSGTYVLALQKNLKNLGAFKGSPGGNFRDLTREAVIYFQQTHLDCAGSPLEVDGIVGEKTWWAIAHPSGAPQKSGILANRLKSSIIPGGILGTRLKLCQIALDERAKKVREIPDGANRGPHIDDYLGYVGLGPNPWCYAFAAWAASRAFGGLPWGTKHGHVKTGWEQARRAGMAYDKDGYDPIPGDLMVMLYLNSRGGFTGSGHISIVMRVSSNSDLINTIGGNEGNRIKFGVRDVRKSSIVGFINPHGDGRDGPSFERGIMEARAVGNLSTR